MSKDMDGIKINIGDYLGFKDDIEDGGRVACINGEYVELKVSDGNGSFIMKQIHCRYTWHD